MGDWDTMPTTTIKAESRLEPAVVAKRRPAAVQVAVQGARRMTWKEVLVRELHALHVQQQDRAFMAPTHGSIYVSSGDVDRKSVVSGKSVSVRVHIGGRPVTTK